MKILTDEEIIRTTGMLIECNDDLAIAHELCKAQAALTLKQVGEYLRNRRAGTLIGGNSIISIKAAEIAQLCCGEMPGEERHD